MGLLADAPTVSFTSRVEWVVDRIDNDELRLFSTLAWSAWFCRNNKIHNARGVCPSQLAASFTKMMANYMVYA